MDIEKVLTDPNASIFNKRSCILKELLQIYKTAQEDGDVNSALKAIDLLSFQVNFFPSGLFTLRDLSDEQLQFMLASGQAHQEVNAASDPQNAQREKFAGTL